MTFEEYQESAARTINSNLTRAKQWNMDIIAWINIEKLMERYPDGFESNKSVQRKENDI